VVACRDRPTRIVLSERAVAMVRNKLFLMAGVMGLLCGCWRTSEPARHEVQKPVSPPSHELPTDFTFPIPEVPERIERPSPPIEETPTTHP